jgi:selenocysteine lyase/cysteine desulfurase
MPWERIVQLCKDYDALSLVDAAHHLGQLPVDLKKVQPDFWVSVSFLGCCIGVSMPLLTL